ncbi:glutamate racemase [Peptoniphilus gorbachii]|uniref:Glutamate racemase n=1 Tax=Peptoniphilus gorbachii TaxID=411567 RepID=A0ABS2ML50_9FIRM|nr:glutamate racemase [Peptoniphilus gorbachii]MBM7550752.1 glutamate racemase [Peptoniphilus gorbachii]MDU5467799.1 glutamate racemase [Peptoniphilus harei]
MKKTNPIGVFDSGVGGLSVLKELLKVFPEENFKYIGDTLRMPYGVRSPEDVKNSTFECLSFLAKEGAKGAVIACNTATCYGLENAQEKLDIPVVGVVEPACSYASLVTKNNKVALIATEGTVKSKVYDETIKKFNKDIIIKGVGAPQLVLDVENGNLENDIVEKTINGYLEELGDFDYDTLILGCTHFPLARKAFERIFEKQNRDVKLVDPANRTAIALKEILEKDDLLNQEKNPKIDFFSTNDIEKFKATVKNVIDTENEETFKEVTL